MYDNISEVEIGEHGETYVREVLEEGLTLSRILLDKIKLSAGRITTFLPENTPQEGLYEFRQAAKKAGPVAGRELPGPEGVNERDSTTRCAERLHSCLNCGPRRIAMFEDPGARPDHKYLQDNLQWPLMFYQDEVYFYVLGRSASLPKIVWTLETSGAIYPPAVCVVAEAPNDLDTVVRSNPARVDIGFLAYLASHTRMIAVAAYDDESYLLWEAESD